MSKMHAFRLTHLLGPEAGLAAAAGASAAGGIVGGVVARANEGKGSTAKEMAKDAIIGVVGSTASGLSGEVVSSPVIAKAADQAIDKGVAVINAVIDGADGKEGDKATGASPILPQPGAKQPTTRKRPPLNCGGPALGGEADCPE